MTIRLATTVAATLVFLLTACNEDGRPVVSLEQAKQITAKFEGQGVTPPPRTIADITAILDQQKPDPAKAAANRKAADAEPPQDLAGAALAQFYFNRGIAAGEIGRAEQRAKDEREAVRIGREARIDVSRMLQDLSNAEQQIGNGVAALHAVQEFQASIRSDVYGEYIAGFGRLAMINAQLGDIEAATTAFGRAQALFDDAPGRVRRAWPIFNENWRTIILGARSGLELSRGQLAAAEATLREALVNARAATGKYELMANNTPSVFPRAFLETVETNVALQLATTLRLEGKLLEAEVQSRAALLALLQRRGRYAPETATAVVNLAHIIADEDRFPEAEKLGLAAVDIYENLGAGAGSWPLAEARNLVAESQAAQDRWDDAAATLDKLAKVLGDDATGQAKYIESNPTLAVVYLNTGHADRAVPILRRVVDARLKQFGAKHDLTAVSEGLLAAALAATGERDQALATFKTALPILTSRSRESTNENTQAATRERRLRVIVESYIGLLADMQGTPALAGIDAPAEAFRLADGIRGQSVQRALADSGARAAVRDPALAELVRREQDAQQQVASLQGVLTTALSAPADQQDAKALTALRTQIDQLRGARAAIREDIEKKFPDYVNLIDPKPATIEQARASLRPGEALIATYVGEHRSFVWAVPARGQAAFAAVAMDRRAIRTSVAQLRRALDPNAATLGDIPAFDVALAHKLYAALLQPVESGWKGANSLLVVPHDALGQLPFAVLVTAPVPLPPDREGQALFANYKTVPFLVRQAAITQLPSVTSLASLRALPPPQTERRPFVGFGDPWFNPQEAAEAQREAPQNVAQLQTRGASTLVAMRGVRLVRRSAPATENADSADLAQLPRLPDTADEVRSVAVALNADPVKDVFTGRDANERRVRTMDLADRRVVMFATHGLVPGDLNGLTQPALALSAPNVADIDGDGLLTLDEVLALRLNADWVVLSACNTAAGDGAGAEAVSGLGRAFFYAGTRAILVSNWPVETTSARLLTSDLFHRQAQSPALTRAQALRQAETALIDGPGFIDPASKATVFAYAHPIFWAPFSLVGDGGGGQPGG